MLAALVVGWASPAEAGTAEDCALAFDVEPAVLEGSSLGAGNESMIAAPSAVGNWLPLMGAEFCEVSTGLASVSPRDFDHPPVGTDGDRVQLEWSLRAPLDARGLRVRATLLSREDPAVTVDEVHVYFGAEGASEGDEVFLSAAGEPLFSDWESSTLPRYAALLGTGCEGGWTSGWYVATLPVQPGELHTLRVSVQDQEDGIVDTSLFLDGLEWIDASVDVASALPAGPSGEPVAELWWPADIPPTLHAFWPSETWVGVPFGLTIRGGPMGPIDEVWVGESSVEFTTRDADTILVSAAPTAAQAGVPTGGSVPIRIVGPMGEAQGRYPLVYVPQPPPPRIDSLEPPEVQADEIAEVVVRGASLNGLSWRVEGYDLRQVLTPPEAENDLADEVRLTLPGRRLGAYTLTGTDSFGREDSIDFMARVPNKGCSTSPAGPLPERVLLGLWLSGLLAMRRSRPQHPNR